VESLKREKGEKAKTYHLNYALMKKSVNFAPKLKFRAFDVT